MSNNDSGGAAAAEDTDELLSQFMAFTGSTDAAKAASYLEMSGNNVETAVGLYMEHEQGGGLDGGGGAAAAGAMPAAQNDIRAPDETRTMRLMEDHHHMNPMQMPMDPSYNLMHAMMDEQITQSAFGSAPPNPRDVLEAAIAAQAQNRDSGESKENSGTSENDDDDEDNDDDDDEDMENSGGSRPAARASQARLSDMFAPPNHLIHKAGGFQGARAMAKDSKRWLLVNIQRDAEFASHALNRDVWRDELVENLIREGFIFWQQMDMTAEGRTYTERYQVRDYPHLGIIDPRTGRLLWRKEGWTQENPMTAELFAEIAMDFCSRNSFDRPPQPPRAAAAARPGKRPVNEMSEAAQMEAAMRASMEDVTAGAKNDDDDDDDEVQYMGDYSDDDDEVQEVEGKPPAAAASEESKPPSANNELLSFAVPDEPADGSRIQMRMPDGKRVVRKFAASDSVRTIYAFVAQSNEEARSGREFLVMAGYPPNDLIFAIDNTIEASKLQGETLTVRWKNVTAP